MLEIQFYLVFFPFSLIIDLYFLLIAIMSQVFNSTTEHTVPTEMKIKEAKVEIQTHLLTLEAKISKLSI